MKLTQLGRNGHYSLELLSPWCEEQLFETIDRNRSYLCTWSSWPDKIRSIDDIRQFIRRSLHSYADRRLIPLCIRYDKQAIGIVSARISCDTNTARFGFWIREESQGFGLVTQSVSWLLTHLYSRTPVCRAEIHSAVPNQRSRKLAERLKFVEEGVLKSAELLNGTHVDHVLYRMLKKDWLGEAENRGAQS